MSIKLYQVKLVWSKAEQKDGHRGVSLCYPELFATIEAGIERAVELVKENPKQIHYLDLSAQYSKATRTDDCIVLTAFYTKVLFYDSCDRRFSVNVGCRTDVLKFDDFAPNENQEGINQEEINPDYDETGHRRNVIRASDKDNSKDIKKATDEAGEAYLQDVQNTHECNKKFFVENPTGILTDTKTFVGLKTTLFKPEDLEKLAEQLRGGN